jgi:hypothetical protein
MQLELAVMASSPTLNDVQRNLPRGHTDRSVRWASLQLFWVRCAVARACERILGETGATAEVAV